VILGPNARERTGTIPPYVVRCVTVDDLVEGNGHEHVTGLETTDPDGGMTRWTLVEAIAAYRDGGRFIVGSGEGEQTAELGPSVCPRCRMATLAVEPADAGIDLERCS
jgi:hypothetical protein